MVPDFPSATTTTQHFAGLSSVDQAAVDLVGSHRPGRPAKKAVLFLDQVEVACQDQGVGRLPASRDSN